MKRRVLSIIVLLAFAFYAIKLIAFKSTVTRSDVVMLGLSALAGFVLNYQDALRRSKVQKAHFEKLKSEQDLGKGPDSRS
jgi:hypothetical protein